MMSLDLVSLMVNTTIEVCLWIHVRAIYAVLGAGITTPNIIFKRFCVESGSNQNDFLTKVRSLLNMPP